MGTFLNVRLRHVQQLLASYATGPKSYGYEMSVAGVDLMAMDPGKKRAPDLVQKRAPKWTRKPLEVKGEMLFGLYPTLLALQARRRNFYKLYVKKSKLKDPDNPPDGILGEILRLAEEQGLAPTLLSTYMLGSLTKGEVHQGVCLDASQRILLAPSLIPASEIEGGKDGGGLWLLMDRIQDPMNFGAVLRSSYYFGVQKVFVPTQDSCRLSPIVSKASSGALEVLDVYSLADPAKFVWELKTKGWVIVGTCAASSLENTCPVYEAPVLLKGRPVLLIMGNEGQGIHESLRPLCDINIFVSHARGVVPAMGSLNVSVAAGIVLHQLSQGTANVG